MQDFKTSLQQADYLIVGQGLAGSVLAMTLINAGHNVVVINDDSATSASEVAAGLYNPIYGKELNITWKADELFPFLIDFYLNLENQFSSHFQTKVNFFHETNIFRSFVNVKQQNKFAAEEDEFLKSGFVKETSNEKYYNELIMNDIGSFLTLQSGWLDVKKFVKTVRDYLISKNAYFSGKYNDSELNQPSKLKKVIFCEGFLGRENRLFNWLPWNPAKGEILTIRILGEYQWCAEIINSGIFIVPIGDDLFRVGATYAWHEFSSEPTEKARLDLIQKLDKLLRLPYEVVGQQAGVRPATKLRRPLVGLHPEHRQFGVFNGFGSKGVSLTPYFAKNFLDFLENNHEIVSEVNIEQFYSLYQQ